MTRGVRAVIRWFRELQPQPMLADVVRDFARVGNDDHADLRRIGQKPMRTRDQDRREAAEKERSNVREFRRSER
jgi:hypothetical protein